VRQSLKKGVRDGQKREDFKAGCIQGFGPAQEEIVIEEG
jgi:hypothetical protein